MEEKKLNLDAPFLSIRRIPSKPENPSEAENTKNLTTTTRRRKVKDSCQETLIKFLQDKSFDHVTGKSSVPFLWEHTPGNPKNLHHHIDTKDSDLIKALDMVSSPPRFSVTCNSNGVSEEIEKNGERLSNVSKDDVILEYRDLIMSRFLPDAKAIAMKLKKVSSLDQVEKMKKTHNQSRNLQRISMEIHQDLKNDDHEDDETVCSNVSRKAMFGFMPRFCSKDSLDVLNPVLSRVKTCQNLILRSSKIMSCKSQEIYPTPRFSTETSKSNKINPSRLQRTVSACQIQRQDMRLLEEEVKRRSNKSKTRSGTQNSVYQPPLPKTPSESWLIRTLPRNSARSGVSGQFADLRKKNQKTTNHESLKWEMIVKTSYKQHDHVRYSEELSVVHPCRQ